ncbi:hypothetical protein Srubr_46340 [Streptomyces rubradiris]|uniref:Short chain dehydrogenase n=1 Tax=Streptomyces rubradiris TaxID=285531 RepID=A0ABQ3RFZ5_STRRR|nr:hypothetical protein GCM10018792_53480 [Streptomyces rubradiris]GHI54788.1 hypothetical protein Srubr_46340 [Streptomyces rubradiris]
MTGARPQRLLGKVVVVTGAARGQGATEVQALAREGAPAFREANIRETPLGRTGTADELAPLVAFLLSDESSF